jgi:hypothetical protein
MRAKLPFSKFGSRCIPEKVAGLQGQPSNEVTSSKISNYPNSQFDEPLSGVGFEEVSTVRCCYKPLVGGNKRASQLNTALPRTQVPQESAKRPHYFCNRAVMSFEKSKLVAAFFVKFFRPSQI